jgi:hypothetical protein
MSALAEDSMEPSGWTSRLLKIGGALLLIALLIGAALYLRKLVGQDSVPKRQVSKISILPDTPPPPPPPPKETKPPPDAPTKPLPDAPVLKAAEMQQPPNAPIKMEGAAGDGPSAFAAGKVNSEYSGGAISSGAAQTGTSSDRAQERFYANTARQLLRDAIEKSLKSEATQATAEFSVWITREGGISRFELKPTGDSRLDGELNAALDETTRNLKLPAPPAAAGQPMKFRLNVRPLG